MTTETVRRATVKGKVTDTFGCRCGASMTVAESNVKGAVIGGIDLARVEFRRLHSEPGCTERSEWKAG